MEPIKDLRSKVEDEKASIECVVRGFPTPSITWLKKLDEETGKITEKRLLSGYRPGT